MSTCKPPGAMLCPPMLCRAPPIDTAIFSRAALRSTPRKLRTASSKPPSQRWMPRSAASSSPLASFVVPGRSGTRSLRSLIASMSRKKPTITTGTNTTTATSRSSRLRRCFCLAATGDTPSSVCVARGSMFMARDVANASSTPLAKIDSFAPVDENLRVYQPITPQTRLGSGGPSRTLQYPFLPRTVLWREQLPRHFTNRSTTPCASLATDSSTAGSGGGC